MKKVAVVLLLLASTTAFAKLTNFHNKQAVQKVLNDQATMNKIANGSLDAEMTGISVSSSGEGGNKKFTVRVTMTAQTPIGPRSCYTDVSLSSETKDVLVGGATISATELGISKMSPAVCQK